VGRSGRWTHSTLCARTGAVYTSRRCDCETRINVSWTAPTYSDHHHHLTITAFSHHHHPFTLPSQPLAPPILPLQVSKGASADAIASLRAVSLSVGRADATLLIGEQCSICRMEFEAEDGLRCCNDPRPAIVPAHHPLLTTHGVTDACRASPTWIICALHPRYHSCLPCGHVEHSECLGEWLARNRACPLCQRDIHA
jgi:hypothetical protein